MSRSRPKKSIWWLGIIIIVIIWVVSKFGDACEENGIQMGTGKLYVLTKADYGKIFLTQTVFSESARGKGNNIGVAYMREDGRSEARWYQLPLNSQDEPVRPTVQKRCVLEPAGDYFFFKEVAKI